jgi:DNA replication protein DnaC
LRRSLKIPPLLLSLVVLSSLYLPRRRAIGDATLADAVLDRLVHNAYELKLKGESRRKNKAPVVPPSSEPS